MAAPTFAGENESTWNSNSSPRTVSTTVGAGDVLVVVGASEDGSTTLGTPSGGSLTYSLAQSNVISSYSTTYAWTSTAASSSTFDVSITASGGGQFGFNTLRFSGSDGIGASAKTNVASGAPSLDITTTQANSAIVVIVTDWNAGSGARTWRTVNSITPSSGNGLEVSYAATGNYTIYAAYYSDAGSAGVKTVGLSAPTGQKYTIIAVEVLGTGSSATNANAENAAATATAETPTTAITANSQASEAAAAANDAQTSTAANGGAATASVSADDASTAVTVNAECATASAAAHDATVSTDSGTSANAEAATAAAAAHDASIALAALAVLADAAAVVDAAAVELGASAAAADATATAADPTTDVAVYAECATATATALDAAGPSARNLDLTIGAPETTWRTGSPAGKWSTTGAETNWQTGNPQL